MDHLWIGWSGRTAHVDCPAGALRDARPGIATLDLPAADIADYYDGYANRTMWPLLHGRADLARSEAAFRAGYRRVNARFAEAIASVLGPDDRVWVQDYHLIPLGAALRARGVTRTQPVGFFLHVPWPAWDYLANFADAREWIANLLAYDVLGFQTAVWARNFRQCAQAIGARLDGDGNGDGEAVWYGGRMTRTVVCPVGIDAAAFAARAGSAPAARLRADADGPGIIGVDRLDYTKGLVERLLGYEAYLDRGGARPLKLLQIAAPSRSALPEYANLAAALGGHAARINRDHARDHWTPVRLDTTGRSRARLAADYRAARIGLVTPLRDGMNLVAKEYVAAQDADDPGVLVLSRAAGAAERLKGALLVDPSDPRAIADALEGAQVMQQPERHRRWRAMMDVVSREDAAWWRRSFVTALDEARPRRAPLRLAATVASIPRRQRRIAVALPVKDEAERIEGCLTALDRAAGNRTAADYVGVITVVAFANNCGDASVEQIAAFRPSHFTLDLRAASLLPGARHAGWARRLAFDAAAEHLSRSEDVLLSTDADSRVDPAWLTRTLRHLDAGYGAVAGLALTPACDRAALGEKMRRRLNLLGRYSVAVAHLRRRADPGAHDPWPRHDYEGGASIALTLGLYRRIGGAPTPPLAEDRALFAAVRAAGGRVRHAVDVRVFTSCRLDGRAPGGMADTLKRWAEQHDDAPVHEMYTVAAMLGHAPRGPPQQVTFRTLPRELAAARRLIRAGSGQALRRAG